ncbi:MAG: HAD family hydrolase [Ginsengibacter sp.]
MKIDEIIRMFDIRAAIFDLDGTLIDNNSYHLQTWKKYLENMGRDISEEEYNANINGRTNKNALEYIYQRKMTDEEAAPLALEKEAMYRELYQPYIAPVPGLMDLLEQLAERKIPMAIATSGIEVNIEFMFNNIPIKPYFNEVVNSSHIKKGKPDPEIYFKTAERLKVQPSNCLVFEDAVVGITAAKSAGMHVIAITTTHTSEELQDADLLIGNYEDLLK